MPTYRVTDPQSGRTVKLTGEAPPTEAELTEIFRSMGDAPTPSAPDAGPTRMQQLNRTLDQGMTDLGIGAAKGLGQTAVNLGKMVHAVPGVTRAVDALYGQPGVSQASMGEADRMLTPSNMTQTVGKGAEQVAELVLPGRAIQGAGAAAAARLGPKLAGTVGQTLGKVLPNAAVQAAGGAGMAAAQGGDPLTGAVLSGVAPAVGGVLERLPAGLRETAAKRITQALDPRKERYKAITKRLIPEIQKRGLGGSREALQQQAQSTLETVGDQLDTALQQYAGQRVPTAAITQTLEASKDAFRTVTQMPVTEAAKKGLLPKVTSVSNGIATMAVEFDGRSIRQLDGLQKIISEVGDTATVEQLVGIRRAWDKVVDQAGGFSHRAGGAIGVPLKEQSEAWAKREATGAIRKLLAVEVPDLAAINKEFTFWKNLDDVVTQTIDRTKVHGPGLMNQAAGAAGSVAGAVAGGAGGGPAGSLGGALAFGKLAKMAETVLTSPRMRFVDAKLRGKLAEAIESGSQSQLATTLGQISAVQTSKLSPAY